MTKAFLIIMAGAAVLAACKKNDTQTTTSQKIINKWGVASTVEKEFFAGVSNVITYTGVAADYVDFRSNGKVYSYVDGEYDTAAYTILGDKYIKVNNTDSLEIKTLTDNTFVLYSKQTWGADYIESTTNLKK